MWEEIRGVKKLKASKKAPLMLSDKGIENWCDVTSRGPSGDGDVPITKNMMVKWLCLLSGYPDSTHRLAHLHGSSLLYSDWPSGCGLQKEILSSFSVKRLIYVLAYDKLINWYFVLYRKKLVDGVGRSISWDEFDEGGYHLSSVPSPNLVSEELKSKVRKTLFL